MNEILMKFETPEQAKIFMIWLCNSGEQDFFQSVEDSEQENAPNSFSYDWDKNIIEGKQIKEEN